MLDIQFFINIIKKKSLLLIIVPLTLALATLIFSLLSPKEYVSRTLIATGITDNPGNIEGNDPVNYFEIQNEFSNLIQNISSRQVLSLVSFRLLKNDMDSPNPFRVLKDSLYRKDALMDKILFFRKKTTAFTKADFNRLPGLLDKKLVSFSPLYSKLEHDDFLIELLKKLEYDPETLAKNMTVARVAGSDYISIAYKSESPELSAFVVNATSDEFINYSSNRKTIVTDQEVEFYKKMVNDKKNELDALEEKLNQYKASNRILNINVESTSLLDRISALELARDDERQKIGGLTAALDKLNSQLKGKVTVTGNKIRNQKIVQLRDEILKKEEEIVNNGRDPKLESEISILRKSLAEEISLSASGELGDESANYQIQIAAKTNTEVEIEISKANINTINNQLADLKSQVPNLAGKEAEILSIEREIKVTQDDYLIAVEKYNDARVNTKDENLSLRQSENGLPPDKPEASKTLLTVVFAWMGSSIILIVVLLIFELLDFRIKSPYKFNTLTGLTLIGSLTQISENMKLRKIFEGQDEFAPDSRFKEQIRKIRYELESFGDKVVLVTSTKKNQGKTVLILSIAYSISLIYKKVLIIDTNFKNNSLTQKLVVKDKSKLKEIPEHLPVVVGEDIKLLQDTVEWNTANSEFDPDKRISMISKTTNPYIDIIGSREGIFSPNEIINPQIFSVMINEFKKYYDFIFMEGPALNDYTDSKELSVYSDGILAVFSADTVLNAEDKESIKFLSSFTEKFRGAILNKVRHEYQEEKY